MAQEHHRAALSAVLGCLLVASFFSHGCKSSEPTSAPVPEKTDEEVLFAATKDTGKYAASLIVKNSRLAPSQTKVVERKLIETRYNFALAYVEVDTPNPYGVLLRKGFCVVLHFTPPRGASYEWNRTAGVVGCDGPPDEETAWAVKLANQWPDIETEPVPFGVEERAKAKRRGRR
jgi:hypothetical protein